MILCFGFLAFFTTIAHSGFILHCWFLRLRALFPILAWWMMIKKCICTRCNDKMSLMKSIVWPDARAGEATGVRPLFSVFRLVQDAAVIEAVILLLMVQRVVDVFLQWTAKANSAMCNMNGHFLYSPINTYLSLFYRSSMILCTFFSASVSCDSSPSPNKRMKT